MLANLLKECGFSEKEQIILTTMLSKSWRAASLIAKDAKLKRPTVYAILDDLIEYGVVLRKKKDGHALYSLVGRELLPKVIERKIQNRFEGGQSAVTALAECLSELMPAKQYEIGGYEVATFESLEVTMHHLEVLLSKGEYVGIFDPAVLSNSDAKQAVLRFLRKTQKSKPAIRELIVAGSMANWYQSQIKNPNHHVRLINPKTAIPTDMIIASGEVLLFHYTQENQGSIRIKHESYCQSMVSLFEMLWSVSIGSVT